MATEGVRDPERRAKILEMREAGQSLVSIGDHFNLSRERIRQIVGNEAVLHKTCHCGKEFTTTHFRQISCSKKCAHQAQLLKHRRPRHEETCPSCGKEFMAAKRQRYCTRDCKIEDRKRIYVMAVITGDLAKKIKDISERTGKSKYSIVRDAVKESLG